MSRIALPIIALLCFAQLALAQAPAPAPAAGPRVKLHTTLGDITVELDADKAPKTVANFLHYVKDGFYSGTIFHRVIAGFMAQGGGFTKDLKEKPTRPAIPNEAKHGLSNAKYTIAMARTRDPDSATSQFYINLADNPNLDYAGDAPAARGYCVFGKVIEGQDVVDKIGAAATGPSGRFASDVPTTPIAIDKAELLK